MQDLQNSIKFVESDRVWKLTIKRAIRISHCKFKNINFKSSEKLLRNGIATGRSMQQQADLLNEALAEMCDYDRLKGMKVIAEKFVSRAAILSMICSVHKEKKCLSIHIILFLFLNVAYYYFYFWTVASDSYLLFCRIQTSINSPHLSYFTSVRRHKRCCVVHAWRRPQQVLFSMLCSP